MADPIINFFKSRIVGQYSALDTDLDIINTDVSRLPDPSVDGAFNLSIYGGTDSEVAEQFEIVRVTAISGSTLTVTRAQEGTTAINMSDPADVFTIVFSATKKTFDDINTAIDSIELANQSLNTTNSVTFNDINAGVFKNPQTITQNVTVASNENGFVMGDVSVTGTITIESGGKLVIL